MVLHHRHFLQVKLNLRKFQKDQTRKDTLGLSESSHPLTPPIGDPFKVFLSIVYKLFVNPRLTVSYSVFAPIVPGEEGKEIKFINGLCV
jgi:hypothetical protein